MKIAVIGCGAWGRNIIRNFAELGVLAGVCDLDMEKTKVHAQNHNTSALTIDEILSDKSIDGVAIITHSYTHFDIAQRCLKAGKHVFVEKPLTMDSGHAFQLEALAKKHNRVLMVGHLLRYHPAFIQVAKQVHEGRIGSIRRIVSNRLNIGNIRSNETVLWDLAPHDLSMVMALVDSSPTLIYARGSYLPESKIMEAASCQLQFRNGVEAIINLSWVNPVKEHKLIVIGDKGMIVFDDTQDWGNKVQIFDHVLHDQEDYAEIIPGKAHPVMVNVGEPLREECQHFLDCIKNHETPLTHAADAAQVIAIIEACHESIEENCSLHYGYDNNENFLAPLLDSESMDKSVLGMRIH